MDTSTYFYAAYMVFWLIPTWFLYNLLKKQQSMENQLKNSVMED